ASGSYGVQSAASVLSLSGHHPPPPRTFAGGGSRPGQLTNPGSDPGARGMAHADGPRFGAAIVDRGAPRSGKLVYVRGGGLTAAICVLAVLLFSGGGSPAPPGRRGLLDPLPHAAATTTVTER